MDDRWWRDTFYTDFARRERKIQIWAKDEKENRAREEAAAWIYELVRRLPDVKAGSVKLPGLEEWPSFVDLPPDYKGKLVTMVEDQLGYRPVTRRVEEGDLLKLAAYSERLPCCMVDLQADNKALVQFFIGWVEDQRAHRGIVRPKGDKERTSHGKRALPKKPDWRLVELLDHEKGEGIALSDAERARRRDAKVCATRFLPIILELLKPIGIMGMFMATILGWIPGASQLDKALREVNQEITAKYELIDQLESLWCVSDCYGLTASEHFMAGKDHQKAPPASEQQPASS